MDSYFQFEHADGLYFVLTFIIVVQFCVFFFYSKKNDKDSLSKAFERALEKARTIQLFKR